MELIRALRSGAGLLGNGLEAAHGSTLLSWSLPPAYKRDPSVSQGTHTHPSTPRRPTAHGHHHHHVLHCASPPAGVRDQRRRLPCGHLHLHHAHDAGERVHGLRRSSGLGFTTPRLHDATQLTSSPSSTSASTPWLPAFSPVTLVEIDLSYLFYSCSCMFPFSTHA